MIGNSEGDTQFVSELIYEFGHTGYYVFYRTLELLGVEFKIDDPDLATFNSRKFYDCFTMVSRTKNDKILSFCERRNKIFSYFFEKQRFIYCPKFKDLLDIYTQRLLTKDGQVCSQTADKKRPSDVDVDIDIDIDLDNNNSRGIFFKCEYFTVTGKDKNIFSETYGLNDDSLKILLVDMKIWLYSHPNKRYKNYKSFINNWLKKGRDGNGTNKGHGKERDEKPKGDGQPYPVDIQ